MLELNSITFKDDETGKIIEVNINGSVTSSQDFTSDEYFYASIFAGIIVGGGIPALTDFIDKKK